MDVGGAATALTWFGALLTLSLGAEWVGRRTRVPKVTVLLLVGVLVGPAGLDVLPEAREQWEPVVTTVALAMVGFLLGREFEADELRQHGRTAVVVAAVAALTAALTTGAGLMLTGAAPPVALALGGIAAASGPAVTLVVVRNLDAAGPLTATVLSAVAITDALAIALFSALTAVGGLLGSGPEASTMLAGAAREIGGGVALGAAVGVPAALLSARIRQGDPTLVEASAVVLLISGLALSLEVSFLLAAVVAGAAVVNIAPVRRPFTAIEHVEWPFLAVFFILGGAALQFDQLRQHGLLVVSYILLRIAGKVAGGHVGARLADTGPAVRRWAGATLLPQAGVGLGLALVAQERFPDVAQAVVPVVVVSTVVFEAVGPAVTRVALQRSGEAGAGTQAGKSQQG